jgi:hypothetical protein
MASTRAAKPPNSPVQPITMCQVNFLSATLSCIRKTPLIRNVVVEGISSIVLTAASLTAMPPVPPT